MHYNFRWVFAAIFVLHFCSFQPKTFVANKEELGQYLPVVSIITDESGKEVTSFDQAVQFL
jgi:hypothetical protein